MNPLVIVTDDDLSQPTIELFESDAGFLGGAVVVKVLRRGEGCPR
jgi:hypothetical protein